MYIYWKSRNELSFSKLFWSNAFNCIRFMWIKYLHLFHLAKSFFCNVSCVLKQIRHGVHSPYILSWHRAKGIPKFSLYFSRIVSNQLVKQILSKKKIKITPFVIRTMNKLKFYSEMVDCLNVFCGLCLCNLFYVGIKLCFLFNFHHKIS